MQLRFIKDDVWCMKVEEVKGKKEQYLEEFREELTTRLSSFEEENKDTLENFKHSFLMLIFETYISKGAISNLIVEEAYNYEIKHLRIGETGIKLNGRLFKKGSLISLKDIDKELVLGDFSNNNIEVLYRFGEIAKTFTTKEELEDAMYKRKDIDSITAINPSDLSNEEIIRISKLIYNLFNFDQEYRETVINPYQVNIFKEINIRRRIIASELSIGDIKEIVARAVFSASWDSVKEAIKNDIQEVAVKSLKKQFQCCGGSLTENKYRYFIIGNYSSTSKGIQVSLTDTRQFHYNWNTIYDNIKSLDSPKQQQLDLFTLAS